MCASNECLNGQRLMRNLFVCAGFRCKKYVDHIEYQLGQLDFGSRCEKRRNIYVDKTLRDVYINRSGVSSAQKKKKRKKEKERKGKRCLKDVVKRANFVFPISTITKLFELLLIALDLSALAIIRF